MFSILKKFKEQDGRPFVHRLCYFGRIVEQQLKGDFEKELNMWVRNVASMPTPLESNEDDFIEGVDPDEPAQIQPYTGYAAIFGAWHVVMIEAENPLMSKFIKHLEAKLDEPNSYYADIWVVHYAEDIPQRAYE